MATSGRDIDERDKRRIQQLRDAGLSVRKVASEARVSPTTVQKILKRDIAK